MSQQMIIPAGTRIGRWTVRRFDAKKSKELGNSWYVCACDCGTTRSIRAASLRSAQRGKRGSTGCHARCKPLPQRGTLFAALRFQQRVTTEEAEAAGLKGRGPFALFDCVAPRPDHPKRTIKNLHGVTSGKTKDCGCGKLTRLAAARVRAWAVTLKDETGKVYGTQTVIRRATREEIGERGPGTWWLVHCDNCRKDYVKKKESGKFYDCRCQLPQKRRRLFTKDRAGETYGGFLIPLRPATDEERNSKPTKPREGALWLFKCTTEGPRCVGEVLYPINRVKYNHTRSCGCLKRKVHQERLESLRANGQLFKRKRKHHTPPLRQPKQRQRPAQAKHQQWRTWKADGLSHGQIVKRWKNITGETVTVDAVKKAIKRGGDKKLVVPTSSGDKKPSVPTS